MIRRYFSVMAAASLAVAVSCVNEEDITQTSSSQSASAYADYEYVHGEVLVKFKSSVSSSAGRQASLLSIVEAEVLETVYEPAGKSAAGRLGADGGKVVLVSSKLGTVEAIARLKKLPEVEYAEPNFIYQHFAETNDPYYANGSLWGMYGDATTPANQYGSQAGEAWLNHTVSETVYIGIIDEGYMYTHPDLSGNAGVNPGEIADNGQDDDGNGYVDDVHGWDFDGNDNTVFDGVDDDHGTHVAGTIGAVGNNGLGVAGVVWDVRLLNAKFLGRRGGTTANAIKAVDYFTDLKTRHGINLVATSNSWGGGGFSRGLYDAIERANVADILFIAAAGNASNDNDSSPSFPASYSNANIISVASITSTGGLSSFSNYGATSVDLGAPGSSIYSTVPTRSKGSIMGAYASYSGTSMATPHVTGAAALFASTRTTRVTAAEIKAAIMQKTEPTSSLSGKCVSSGRLNASELATMAVPTVNN